MSNTLNTPIEALELEFPLRVESYQLRRDSGGDGVNRGGEGIERRVRVLEPATLSLLTDRRRHGPPGKNGGGAGACGAEPAGRRTVAAEGDERASPGPGRHGADARRRRLGYAAGVGGPLATAPVVGSAMSTRRRGEAAAEDVTTAIFDQVGTAAGLRFDRSSTAERVADVLRELIISGDLPPGTPLREQQLVASLEVSRNTIREAFRLLGRERLVVYQLHRGVAVRQLDEHDVHDIYRTRRPLELMAIEYSAEAPPAALLGARRARRTGGGCGRGGRLEGSGHAEYRLPSAPRRADRQRADQRVLPGRRRRVAARVRAGRAGRALRALHPAQPQDRRALGGGQPAGCRRRALTAYLDEAERVLRGGVSG